MKKLILCLLLALPATSYSQNILKADGHVAVSSDYIWRGGRVCGAHFQPEMNFRLAGFTAQFYGYVAFDGNYKEIDLDLSYRWRDLSFHIADYFSHGSTNLLEENYFNWNKKGTVHYIEGIICYEPESLPFYAKWFTFLYGDWLPDSTGGRGEPSYSSYLELEGHLSFGGKLGKASFICGSSVFPGHYTHYTNWFAPIHLELKYSNRIKTRSLQFPLSVSYIVNPYDRKTFMNASVGVAF